MPRTPRRVARIRHDRPGEVHPMMTSPTQTDYRASETIAVPGATHDLPLTVIEPARGWRWINLRELWRYRELLYFLTWRDIKVRYKQTVLGAAWAVIQPLATMAVFALFLGRATGLTGDLPYSYSLFVLAGLLPWMFFANAVSSADR